MTARQIDEAARSLRELRVQTLEDLTLAGVAFALALAASRLFPGLALPLLAGAATVTFLGVRALVRRWLLLEDLAVERDAYAIGDVRRFGARVATEEHRRFLARSVLSLLDDPAGDELRPELEQLAVALEDGRRLDPPFVVAADRLVRELPGRLAEPAELRADLRRLLASLENV